MEDLNFDAAKRVGAKIAHLRKKKKLSQMKVAEIVDMNFNYIGQIERGEANVTLKTLTLIANAIGVKLVEFFDFSF